MKYLIDSETVDKLVECLDWYVANDDVNTEEGNEFWIDGRNEAVEVLNKVFKEDVYKKITLVSSEA